MSLDHEPEHISTRFTCYCCLFASRVQAVKDSDLCDKTNVGEETLQGPLRRANTWVEAAEGGCQLLFGHLAKPVAFHGA